MKLVFVCSPYSGDVEKNAQNAQRFCRYVVDSGHIPIAPHLLFPQFMDEETEREEAMVRSIELLKRCDWVWIFGDKLTSGMNREIGVAIYEEIPFERILNV